MLESNQELHMAGIYYAEFIGMSPYERKKAELQQMLQATNLNRHMIEDGSIEQASNTYTGSRGVYWELHKNNLSGNPFIAINAPSMGGVTVEVVDKARYVALLQTGRSRIQDVRFKNYRNVGFSYVPKLEEAFFSTIDGILENPDNQEMDDTSKFEFLARTDIIQTLAHFPFEASGRTNSDFTTYLARRLGLDINLTRTGLRSFLGDTLIANFKKARTSIRQSLTYDTEMRMRKELGIPEVLEPSDHADTMQMFVDIGRESGVKSIEEMFRYYDKAVADIGLDLITELAHSFDTPARRSMLQPHYDLYENSIYKFVQLFGQTHKVPYLVSVPPQVVDSLAHLLFIPTTSENIKTEELESMHEHIVLADELLQVAQGVYTDTTSDEYRAVQLLQEELNKRSHVIVSE
jgi:hypothetical protein